MDHLADRYVELYQRALTAKSESAGNEFSDRAMGPAGICRLCRRNHVARQCHAIGASNAATCNTTSRGCTPAAPTLRDAAPIPRGR